MNYILNKNYLLISFLLFLNLVVAKFFVNDEINYDKAETRVSFILHLFDSGTIFLAAFIVLYFLIKKKIYYQNNLLIFFLIFYIYALCLSFFSKDFFSVMYMSLKGLMFTISSIYLLYLIKIKNIYTQIMLLKNMTLLIFLFGFLGSVISAYKMSDKDIFLFGTQGGMFTIFGYFWILLSFFIEKNKKIFMIKSLIIIIIAMYMNSVSSLLVFLISLIVFVYYKNKILFFIVLSILSIVIYVVILNIDYTSIQFANKDMSTILEGTGRFLVYEYSWKEVLKMSQGFFGVGLGAEHILLDDIRELPWSHTSHNSFLACSLGLGVPGMLLYMRMMYLIFFQGKKNKEYLYLDVLLVAIFIYGITNAVFPGNASILIPYSIFVYQIRFNIKRRRYGK